MKTLRQEVAHNVGRVRFALAGILYALTHDRNFKLQVAFGVPALFIFYYLFRPLSETELFFLILAAILCYITELQNSAYEEALDHLHPELHEKIGRSKDMAAGSVLLAACFLLFVLLYIALT